MRNHIYAFTLIRREYDMSRTTGKNGNDVQRCAFCGRTANQVKILMESENGLYICDNCVLGCAEIIDEQYMNFEGFKDEAKIEKSDIN